MSNTKTVIFHGYLKQICPEPITVVCDTAAEAVQAVTSQIKAFQPVPGKGRHVVSIDGDPFASDGRSEIHVFPAFAGGGGNGGFLKILLGAVLIATAFLNPAGIALTSTLIISQASLFFAGATMLLGGLLELISPAPTLDSSSASQVEASKYLGTPQNTTKLGTRIPLLFGTHLAYGHYLSVDIDATDVAISDDPNDDGSFPWPWA